MAEALRGGQFLGYPFLFLSFLATRWAAPTVCSCPAIDPNNGTNYTQKPPKLWSKLYLFCFQLDYHQHVGTATEQQQTPVLRKLKVSVSSYYSPVKVSSIALTDMYCTVQTIFPCLGPRLFLSKTWFQLGSAVLRLCGVCLLPFQFSVKTLFLKRLASSSLKMLAGLPLTIPDGFKQALSSHLAS